MEINDEESHESRTDNLHFTLVNAVIGDSAINEGYFSEDLSVLV